jgi:amino acid permease
MFDPQSYPMEVFEVDPDNDNATYNEDDKNQISTEQIDYQTEDYNVNNSRSSNPDSNVSYFGIRANSILSGVLNISASTIGAGCFTFPWIISTLGLFNSIFIFSVVSGCIYYSLDLLRSFVVDTKNFSFSSITDKTLGKKWLMLYSFSSFIYYLSINLNYMSLLYSIFKSLFIDDQTFYGFIFLLVSCNFEIFLCLYTSKTAKMHLLSIITMFSFAIIVLVTTIEGIHSFFGKDYDKFSKKKLLNPSEDQGGWQMFFISITACIKYIYGYSYHSSFPTLLGNLKNINDLTSMKVHKISFYIICGSYILISFFGYLIEEPVPRVLYRGYEDSNEKDYFTIALKFIIFVFLFTLIPSRYITIRDGYTCLIGKENLTYKKDLLITTLSLVISNCIVFLNEEVINDESNFEIDIFSIFVYIFGGLFGVIICFGLPVINYAAINGKKKFKSLIGYIITGIFFVVGLLSFGYSFNEMFIPKKEEEE